MKEKKLIVAGLLLAFILTVLAVPEVYAKNYNPGVLPPHSKVLGKTYGEWGDIWWNWAVQSPSATNPMLDETGNNCAVGQSGRVWFLAGVLRDQYTPRTYSVNRTCTVPAGKILFFPLVNYFEAAEGSEQEERGRAKGYIDGVSVLECTVDGIPLQNLLDYRAQSPEGGFVLSVPPNSLFTEYGASPGDYAPAVSDGYWIMLPPLSVGMHEINFRVVYGDPENFDHETIVIYHLMIEPLRP